MSTTGRWVAAAVAAVAVAHVVAAFAQAGPVAVPDVPGYLSVAQWVAGGRPPPSFGYHPGYGLLLAPVATLGASAETLHTAALLLNAGMAALVVVLAAALLRSLDPSAGRVAHVLVVGVAALHPSVSVAAQIAWPETILVVLVLACTLLAARLGRVDGSGGSGTAVALGAVVVSGVLLHPRAAALAVGVVAAVVVVARPGWRRVLEVAAGAGAAGLVTVVALAWAYTGPAGGDRVATLVDAEQGGVGVVGAVAGQLVALAGGTGGLAVVGLAGAAGAAFSALQRRRPDRGPSDPTPSSPSGPLGTFVAPYGDQIVPMRTDPAGPDGRAPASLAATGAFLAVAIAVALLGSGASLAGSDRADTFAYGRYLDPYAIALVVFAMGSGAFRRRRELAVALASVVAAGALVAVTVEGDLRAPLRIMVLATDPLWQLADGRLVGVALGVAVLSGVVIGCAWVAARASGTASRVATAMVVVIVLGLAMTATVTGQRHVAAVGEVAAGQATGAAVVAAESSGAMCLAHDRGGVPSYALWLYRLALPDLEHRRVSLADGDRPCSPLVVASTRADHRPGCAEAELLVDEPQGSWGVWDLSGCVVHG
ncbi:MAG: hypothetical protein JJE52_13830 [Acidimicrobiia bacterium]|nr:hypothetical protein [Acidimicrobiia bacterium]